MGHLFEQFVGLELLRISRTSQQAARIRFWRDPDGPEVDWVVEAADQLIPVEAKWTTSPSINDARHLRTFLNEYPLASKGFVVCRIPRPMSLSKQVTAIPWQELGKVMEG